MRAISTRIVWRVLVHAAVIAALYVAFSLALFLGLQVHPMFGNLGLAMVAVLCGVYVYLGFIRRR